MANTPYQDLGSQDILSAHTSGIQHDIIKLQEILDLNTSSVSGHSLTPVADQDDPSLRYKIYEGSIRNWLNNPAPVIYREGVEVDPSEYTLQAPYGAIVFNAQQNSNDSITADFDHITNSSNRLSSIESDISTNASNIQDNTDSVNNMDISGSRGVVAAGGFYASHNRDGFAELADNTAMAPNLLDAFPFPVTHSMTLDYMACRVDSVAGTNGAMAIYSDDGNGYPDQLVADAGMFSTGSTGWKYQSVSVTLQPGLYWLCRNQDGSCGFAGFWYDGALPIGCKIDTIPTRSQMEALRGGTGDSSLFRDSGYYGGYRGSSSAGLSGGFPQTFPSGMAPFSRAAYGSPFIRRA